MENLVSSQRINLFGVELIPYEVDELLALICATVRGGSKRLVLSGNVRAFNLAYEREWLREFFNWADVVRIDGAGVRFGARLLGYHLPGRITWADFAWDLAEFSASHGFRLFFLGGRKGVARAAAERLLAKFPELQIVGTHHGYFDKRSGSAENEAIISMMNEARSDILIVGFGMPLQERWLMENWDRLDVRVALTGGAVFDYVSGNLARAPRWMTDNGLEWLGRLLIEPRRLWRRYLIGNPLFLWRVLKQRFGRSSRQFPRLFRDKGEL